MCVCVCTRAREGMCVCVYVCVCVCMSVGVWIGTAGLAPVYLCVMYVRNVCVARFLYVCEDV